MGASQSIDVNRIVQRLLPVLPTGTALAKKMGGLAHAFHATRDHTAILTSPNAHVRHHDSIQP
jgi:hypothetical protein